MTLTNTRTIHIYTEKKRKKKDTSECNGDVEATSEKRDREQTTALSSTPICSNEEMCSSTHTYTHTQQGQQYETSEAKMVNALNCNMLKKKDLLFHFWFHFFSFSSYSFLVHRWCFTWKHEQCFSFHIVDVVVGVRVTVAVSHHLRTTSSFHVLPIDAA